MDSHPGADNPQRVALLGTDLASLKAWVSARGFPGFHAREIWRWVWEHRAISFDAMNNIPRALRTALDAEWSVFTTQIAHRAVASDGTEKLLLECRDGKRIEAVLMSEETRRTICISSQVGCAMGCVFCASGLKGVLRNLTSAEIVEEVLQLRNLLPPGEKLTNIVVMGMGESLANLDALIRALDHVCAPEGLGLSPRRVTISTVGLPDKIRKLAALNRPFHLAVSLHAPTEDQRNALVPVNRKIGLHAVLEAADDYFAVTGRQVTYEYVLLKGINDRREDAVALGRLLAHRKSHVNVIPYNPVEGLPYERPTPEALAHFVQTVRNHGVSLTVRKTKGRQIDAACGQLRRRKEKEEGDHADLAEVAAAAGENDE